MKHSVFRSRASVEERVKVEHRSSFSAEKAPSTIKKTKTEKLSKNWEKQARQRRMNYENPRIIDVQNYSIFTATWNVAGRSPPSDLNLDEWLHSSAPADIYVLEFQEIVPLNAGNILGAEDNGPAQKWLSLIRKTLNNRPGTSGTNGYHTPSHIPVPMAELDADFSGSTRQKNSTFFHRRSFQTFLVSLFLSSDLLPSLGARINQSAKLRKHIISPFDPRFRAWEMWLVILVIYSAWICPFEFAFITYEKDALFVVDNIVNGFFAIDIILTFFVAYLDSHSYLLVDNPKKMAISHRS